MGFNKGEWSELYTILYLLKNQNLIIVDENLQIITDKLFKLLEILFSDKKYKIDNSYVIKIFNNSDKSQNYQISYLSEQMNILLNKIVSHQQANGSFQIAEIQPLINDFLMVKNLKVVQI